MVKLLIAGLTVVALQAYPFHPGTLCYGDSIAVGYCRGLQGYQKNGANPSQVYSFILSDYDKLHNRDVVISTGVSNGHRDFKSIEKQFDVLRYSSARSVTVLGAAKGRYDAENVKLIELCRKYGFICLGGFTPGKDNVHPRTYKRYE